MNIGPGDFARPESFIGSPQELYRTAETANSLTFCAAHRT